MLERALEAMRELNGRNDPGKATAVDASTPSEVGKPKRRDPKRAGAAPVRPVRPEDSSAVAKPPKRSRLPAAAVKDMRLVSPQPAWVCAAVAALVSFMLVPRRCRRL